MIDTAATTGTDADWVVKLLDVYPADEAVAPAMRGRQLMIANDVYRGRFRSGFEHPAALTANQVLQYAIDLHSASHVFKRGHRIAVQIQSTWFPLIDRNPQTFVPSIYQAKASDYMPATQRIFCSPALPSHLVLPVISFPYRKMGQSASGFDCDLSGAKFGPFEKQLFVGDQTHSTIMRAFLERVP